MHEDAVRPSRALPTPLWGSSLYQGSWDHPFPVPPAAPTALSVGRAQAEAPSIQDPKRGCFLEGAASLQGAWDPCFTHLATAVTVSRGAACMGVCTYTPVPVRSGAGGPGLPDTRVLQTLQ